MSVEVLSWVLRNSPATQGRRLVLIALADNASDDGSDAYPSIATLSLKTRLSERAVQYALRRLEHDGQIVKTGYGPHGTQRWRIVNDLHIGRDF